MSYIRIWVHCVWTTKNRIAYLTNRIRVDIMQHILANSRLKGIYIDLLNGDARHFHALISMGGIQNISEIMKNIKGESSFWINKNSLTRMKFEWQDDFWSISVGESELESLRKYIRNQEEHHKKITLEEEIERIMERMNNSG